MFLDWKNQYCQNDFTAQGSLQIQCISIKLLIVFFIGLEQGILKFVMETQKIPNAKTIFFFLRLHPRHMEVPRLGVQLEQQLLAYTVATGTWDLSCVCDLHHSSWQR